MKSTWRRLNREISSCKQCKAIVETRNRPILGIGSPKAKIFIVGLAPGKDGADLTGIPFTRDPSGELIEEMLSIAGLSRGQDVFITNLLKCNPKDVRGRNRTPSKTEIENCLPYLRREREYIKPRIIVTLGKAATELLLNIKNVKMSEIHGKRKLKKGFLFFPFVHPSYVIRGAYDKQKYLREFKVLGDIFRDLIKQESRLSRLDILLLLLEKCSDDGSIGFIRGKTKLQKLLFLVQNELAKRGYRAKYAFRPYLYGPYSRELYIDIEWLRMNDLVDVKTTFDEDIGLMADFSITKKGKSRLMDLIESRNYRNINEIVEDVAMKYGEMSTTQLVEFVHEEFSHYHRRKVEEDKNSRINTRLDEFMYKKSKVLTDRSKLVEKEI